MQYVGLNTLSILTWHFLSFKLVSLFIIILYDLPIERLAEFPVVDEYAKQGWFVLYFMVGVFTPLSIIYFQNLIKQKWEMKRQRL